MRFRMKWYEADRLVKGVSTRLLSLQQDINGAATAEYAMILAIITVAIFVFFAPNPNSDAVSFYDALRDGYRRVVVFVSVPLL